MKWNQGRAAIERMLASRELERVPASREHEDRLVAQARQHVRSADAICDIPPPAGMSSCTTRARKALTAVLENQGLRPTSQGGHMAVYQAVRAQLDPPMGKTLRPFDRMRRQRNDIEYPPTDTPQMTAADVREDLEEAHAIIDLASGVLDEMSPF